MNCEKFGWNWPSGSWEEDFFNFVNVFSLFRNYLRLEKGCALHLNKLEPPSPKDALCQIWLRLVQWSRRRRFLNFVNVFSLFRNYLPLEKGRALHLNNLNPLPQGCFVPNLVEIGPVVLEKKIKMWKVYGQTDTRTTNDRRSEKLTWAFGSGELKRGSVLKEYPGARCSLLKPAVQNSNFCPI